MYIITVFRAAASSGCTIMSSDGCDVNRPARDGSDRLPTLLKLL